MKLRTSVVFLLLVTVVAPIVLYTDRLGSFTTPSSSNDFIEDVSTFTLGGDVRPLNLLPREPSTTLKEPLGVVYLENSSISLSDSDASTRENSRKIRQLTQDSMENQTTLPSTRGDTGEHPHEEESTIRQVTERGLDINQGDITLEKPGVTSLNESREPQNDGNRREEIKNENQSAKTSIKAGTGEPVNKRNEKQNVRTVIADARVRHLKDQLIQGRVYLSLTATRNNPHFIRELRLRMKEVQRALGDATKDSDLPKNSYDKLKAMELTLAKGKQIQDDCAAVVKKLRAIIHSTEEQLRAHKKQTLFLTHLTAKTLPKGLHCLPLRLTTEYFSLNSSEREFPNQEKLEDSRLFHYALFTDNILAAAVVVNSTVSQVKDPSAHVFHLVTDRINYAAMRMWFLSNPPGNATIQVQNIEEFTWLNSSYSPVLKQLSSPAMIDYYFKTRRAESDSNMKYRNPKYLSVMNHLRFYMPEIFPKLNKVLFLDDDIVVQKDLTGLWSIDLKGNVIGVVETCGESFHRFDRYLNFSNPLISKAFDPHACGWAFGMNIFDLEEWKRQNITEVYHSWQNLNHDRQLWKLGTLPPGLITFWNSTYSLDRSWHVLGLGYDPNVSQKDIERGAVIHYNGNLKPWLEIAIPKYRGHWAKFIDYDHLYLRECNINP
ncbi:probable galacturonosyltransferase 4 [Rhododendron vialii]|uniref:probable galacturonosyltransferase 4 n=1 Tax=Rhododendron vialii TaxID=182163 RepID=UPI00265FB4FF|nr:probable galacturonosyltransferase 4 [Rhododendron vialii]XP_058202419.1 probable galacturonosyltransferase 4 [Rhododendron vialii]XP_058202420.1 probable galacturonosyltransferase 4 [Rhododendron vialii]